MSVISNNLPLDEQQQQQQYSHGTTLNGSMKRSVVLSTSEWDHQFHGSVHTATIAVCIVLVIFVVILGMFGNGLVLLSSFQCRKLRRSNFDILVYNLAIVDFIICSCLSPMFLYLLFCDPPFPLGFCGGYLFVCTACGLQSLLTLVAIAAYRQSRIRGLRASLTGTKTTCILLSIYTVSFASAIGGTLQVTLTWDSTNTNCQSIINSSDILSNNVVLFFISPIAIISLFLITISYIIIARAVKLQTILRSKALQPILKPAIYKQIPPGTETLKDYNGGSRDMKQLPPENMQPSNKPKKSSSIRYCSCCSCAAALDKESKAVSMCYVVIVIIALCWTPIIISHLVELITGESIILYQVKLCGIALVFLNSALDPYMYAQNNTRKKQRYAQIFWDMLRCECKAPPRTKYRTSSPGFLIPRTSPNVFPEEGFLPFIQPNFQKPTTVLKQYPRFDIQNTNLNYKSDPKLKYHANNRNYSNSAFHNLLQPSRVQEPQTVNNKCFKKGNPQSSVRTLVHKTCCNRNSPDDQSLMDSSLPR